MELRRGLIRRRETVGAPQISNTRRGTYTGRNFESLWHLTDLDLKACAGFICGHFVPTIMRNSETPLRQENSARQISGVRALSSVALGVGETYNNAAKDLADSLRQLCLKFALKSGTSVLQDLLIGEIWTTISRLAEVSQYKRGKVFQDPHLLLSKCEIMS